MKIGVNARFLTKPHTGIGQHTRALFTALAEENSDVEFALVVPEKVDITFPENVEIFVVPEQFLGTSGMRKTYWEQWQVPQFLLKCEVDVIHFPYPSNPWRKFEKPVVVTVHDTIPWTSPEYRRSLSTRLYQDRCKKGLQYADQLLTVSKVSRQEIHEFCHVSLEKIGLSYNAPAPIFSNRSEQIKKNAVLARYGLSASRPYFFYIGGYDERKNVKTLVETFTKYIAPHYDVDLILAGGKVAKNPIYSSFDELTSGHEKVVSIGFVAAEDLPVLYQSARAFAHLSLKEGCNLPLLEAAVSHIPVVASDIPVHREMVGNIAQFCGPHDQQKLAEILIKLLTDEPFYNEQLMRAAQYRCPFSWQETAKNVMAVYEKMLRS